MLAVLSVFLNESTTPPPITCRWLTCFEHLTRHSQRLVVEFGINWPALEEFSGGQLCCKAKFIPRCVMGTPLLVFLVELWVLYVLIREVLPAPHLPLPTLLQNMNQREALLV